MTARMVLLRHGATEWSQSGQHTGRTDIPLLDLGREQAKAAGELLRGMTFAQVLTSPLQRAADHLCAGRIRRAVRSPTCWSGTTAPMRAGPPPRSAATRPGWTLWTDGVIDGERAADVGRRVDRVIERARQLDGDTLCVAHGHVLRVLTARWLGLATRRGPALRSGHRHGEHPWLGS